MQCTTLISEPAKLHAKTTNSLFQGYKFVNKFKAYPHVLHVHLLQDQPSLLKLRTDRPIHSSVEQVENKQTYKLIFSSTEIENGQIYKLRFSSTEVENRQTYKLTSSTTSSDLAQLKLRTDRLTNSPVAQQTHV